ncbi:MAG: c-type cytochrome, partial [Burkholderiales bacterium]|nr:c-type cytochrome [Burkholderiales bacterium]
MRVHTLACAAAVALAFAPPVRADARRGETLYRQNCAVCHSTLPGDPIGRGAGRPDVIANAILTNPAMRFFQALLNATDIADIADFLAERFAPPPP